MLPFITARRLLSSKAAPIICSLEGVTKRVGPDRVLFASGINAAFTKGAKIGVLGPNGIGKSSLLKIIAGIDTSHDGQVKRSAHLTIEYLEQEPDLNPLLTVLDNIRRRLQHHFDTLRQYDEVLSRFAEPDVDIDALVEQQSHLQTVIDDHDLWNLDRRIDMAMASLNCPPPAADVQFLSGGERRRVALCSILLTGADLLLLDEPTNHLDAASVAWLEQYLQSYKGAVLAVTHDRYFLDNVATVIVEVDTSSIQVHVGNYSQFLEFSAHRAHILKRTLTARDKQIAAELGWIRGGGHRLASKARRKSLKTLISSAEDEAQVESGFTRGRIIIPTGRRLGHRVLSCRNLSKAFNGRQLIKDLSFQVDPGMVLGIVGANGTGKSTLLQMLIGELAPDSGQITLGSTVEIGYVLQSRQELNPSNTVFQEIVPDLSPVRVGPAMTMPARQYVAQFNFTGQDQEKLIEQLSGGERNRVHLAKLLRNGCNLLILDEPTNDLDVGTLRALEDGLSLFPGSTIVVSHDRWFLDRSCTHILAFQSDGLVRLFHGNYTEYAQGRVRQ